MWVLYNCVGELLESSFPFTVRNFEKTRRTLTSAFPGFFGEIGTPSDGGLAEIGQNSQNLVGFLKVLMLARGGFLGLSMLARDRLLTEGRFEFLFRKGFRGDAFIQEFEHSELCGTILSRSSCRDICFSSKQVTLNQVLMTPPSKFLLPIRYSVRNSFIS